MGGDLIREARKRAGLTQRELAERAGTTQSAIARWEAGRSAPSFDTVRRLIRLCGLDLEVAIVPYDDSDIAQAQALLRLSPQERLEWNTRWGRPCTRSAARSLPNMVRPDLHPEPILRVLDSHGVRYVLIGGIAAVAHGSPLPTEDVDVTPQRTPANLARLSAALEDLGAQIRVDDVPDGMPFHQHADSPAALQAWNLTTAQGDLDISFVPTGTGGFDDLAREAQPTRLFGVTVLVASLPDVIRSKQAANRPKDQRALPVLRELLARQGEARQ